MKYKVSIDVSVVFELLGSFMIYVTRKWTDNLDIGTHLITDMDTRLPQEFRTELGKAYNWPFLDYDVLYALAILREQDTDITSFIDWIGNTAPDDLYPRLLPYMPSLTMEHLVRVKTDYPPLLRLWYEYYFADIEPELEPLICEDAQEKSVLLLKMEPEGLIEYATGGVILDDIPVDSILLFPGVHFRPINTYCFYDNILLIQYPVDIPEENEDDPPVVLLRMTEALADPERLRLLRYVANEPKTVNDIATNLNQPYDTLMHHLLILRAAGLLRSHVNAGDQTERFSLRPDGAAELQMFFESYLRLS
ncbi:ArsR family transcriptional regulator [Paenibacillus sp. N3/727]|uniref:ArsR/SmtB family transcription factor n=1 Tax=Paenibacillus sp. N3/727 TaxID=2925845 RepID=UPI001F537200|nr:ArsR family transcriptional regulator [Paenibacillus sp. N3/727]UNK20876.1 ArsR family transcriptional regulator [Paenibacillus sp. N3/727]